MTTALRSCLACACFFLAAPTWAQSRNELKLGHGTGAFGANASVPLTLSTTDQVQGLVASYEWDSAKGTGVDLVPGAAIATADTVVRRIEAGFMVLGVVMDSDGLDAEIIQPGDNLPLGTAVIRCGTVAGSADVKFVDGKYNTVDGGPLLDNVVVVGGESIAVAEGLILTNGSFDCVERLNRFYFAPNARNTNGRCGPATVLMDNARPVEGYVVAVCHSAADLDLTSIDVGQAAVAQQADFSDADVFANGGTLGVVIDLTAPFTNNTIPPGEGQAIAVYNYCCKNPPATCGQSTVTALTFCDNVIGDPVKENVIVNEGLSIGVQEGLVLETGSFTCTAVGSTEICTDGIDNDCDGLIDTADPECPGGQNPQMFACGARKQDQSGMPGPLQGSLGTAVEVCFFYKSPEDNAPGHAQLDHIQGLSMALTFCCDIKARDGFDIAGTIVEAVGAEFVSTNVDNNPSDGDGCELVIGILVDALPPFDGATLPPTDVFARVGCVTFDIADNPALCGKCCPIQFTDGINGAGKVPIKNLISAENGSISPQLMNCELCIVDKERFFRGDCNFSNMGAMSVDIADAAAVISFLFLQGTWKFQPPCLDACDCNDDGRVDLADAVCILQYLFQFGRFPPDPGPGIRMTDRPNPNMVEPSPPGPDPTPDKLDCKAGNGCL